MSEPVTWTTHDAYWERKTLFEVWLMLSVVVIHDSLTPLFALLPARAANIIQSISLLKSVKGCLFLHLKRSVHQLGCMVCGQQHIVNVDVETWDFLSFSRLHWIPSKGEPHFRRCQCVYDALHTDIIWDYKGLNSRQKPLVETSRLLEVERK